MERKGRQRYIGRMHRHEVIARLKDAEPALRAFGVAALYLFGSHARDEAQADSDIDVFVDPASSQEFGFIPYMDAYRTIQDAVGGGVIGYSTREGLSPHVRADIERQAIRVF